MTFSPATSGQATPKSVSGFTLIELLVVIAIIGMLSSIVLASLNSARMKSRDARRVADMGQIRNALELYYSDHGYYPQSYGTSRCPEATNGGNWDCNGYSYSYDTSWASFASDLAPYISKLPVDPLNSGDCPPWAYNCYTYAYGNVGRSTYAAQYDLTAQFEDPNNPYRCAVRQYYFYFTREPWCGIYSTQVYEASMD